MVLTRRRLRITGPSTFFTLIGLLVCLVPDLPAQTTGGGAPHKGKDTTATHSPTPKPPGRAGITKGTDSTTVESPPAARETPEEQDTTSAAHSHKPVKAGKRSAIYHVDEDVPETAWELDASIDYDTWRVRRGVEFSHALPSLTPGLLLTHESGLSLECDAMSAYGQALTFTLWYIVLGYEYDFADWATGSVQFTRYRYTDQEENALASKFNAWTLIGNFDAQICAVDLTFDLYPGDGSALYATLDVSTAFEAGDFTFTPMFETCYLSQTLHLELPAPLPPKDLNLKGFATLSLQCEIAWQATDQLAFSLTPGFTRFPMVEVVSKIRGFSSTLNATYSLAF